MRYVVVAGLAAVAVAAPSPSAVAVAVPRPGAAGGAGGEAPAAEGLEPLSAADLDRIRADEPRRARQAREALLARRGELGLSAADDLTETRRFTDEFGRTHVRFARTFRGVRVAGAQLIAHVDAEGEILGPTLAPGAPVDIATTPVVTASAALAVARRAFGADAEREEAVLELVPVTERVRAAGREQVAEDRLNATDLVTRVNGYVLVWTVTLGDLGAQDGPRAVVYHVDATDGEVRDATDLIRHACESGCTGVEGSGDTFYNGAVDVDTADDGSSYWLLDPSRETAGGEISVHDFDELMTGDPYEDSDNAWGDGSEWDGASDPNGEATAAADVMYALQGVFDMYDRALGWDPAGESAAFPVAYLGSDYANAGFIWGILLIGDGDGSFGPLTAVDIVSHEVGHATQAWYDVADESTTGEHAGLQEGLSDIVGTLTEHYVRGDTNPMFNVFTGEVSETIPDDEDGSLEADWVIGNEVDGLGDYRRDLADPSDFDDPEAWSADLATEYSDPHAVGVPLGRAFYFLAQGAPEEGDLHSAYLDNGMAGIGNHKAGKIAWRAITVYFTDSTDYSGARDAFLDAAYDLYGEGDEYAAVENAFAGINVGSTATGDGWPSDSIAESETNDAYTQSDPLHSFAEHLTGTLSSGSDDDWFHVRLAAGQSIRLTDTSCRTVVGPVGSPVVSYTAPVLDIELRDRGSGSALSWTDDDDSTGSSGICTDYDLDRTYTNSSSAAKTVALGVTVDAAHTGSIGSYDVVVDVDDLTVTAEMNYEGNDSTAAADFVTQPDVGGEDTMVVEGMLSGTSDTADYYDLMLRPGQTLTATLELTGSGTTSGVVPVPAWSAAAYDQDGTLLDWVASFYGLADLELEASNAGSSERRRIYVVVGGTNLSTWRTYDLSLAYDPVATGRT